MTTPSAAVSHPSPKPEVQVRTGGGDAVYAIGLIGAWVFYISRARTFPQGLLGFLKGFIWPALLVHALLQHLEQPD
jgi:hypothetical protein